jgi:septum formation protein
MKNKIILATQSEIRKKLLKNTGIHFKSIKSDFDETQLQDSLNGKECSLEDVQDLAKKLSYEKAKIISDRYNKDLIIGCDQTLFFKKRILNKPANYDESFEQLKGLSGENHKLITATTCVMESKQIWSYVSVQDMNMRKLSDEYIKNYIKEIGDSVLNILGGYEIEGKGINLFDSIGDDLFSIQGISILQLTKFLRKVGYIE